MRYRKLDIKPPTEAEKLAFRGDRIARYFADSVAIFHLLLANALAILGELTPLFKFTQATAHQGIIFVYYSIDYPLTALFDVLGSLPLGGGSSWLALMQAQLVFVPATLLYGVIVYLVVRLLVWFGGG